MTDEKLRTDIAVLTERIDNSEKALKLQGLEYERRLGILNHEADQLKTMQSSYLPRELHDSFKKEMLTALGELKTSRDEGQGRGQVITTITSSAISISIGLLFLGLNWLIR